jgi:transposase
MQTVADRPEAPNAIRNDLGAIFISLELSRSTWLITSLSPGGGEKMSKHSVPAGDIYALLARFLEFKQKAFARTGKSFPIIVIQEAGLDGFWIHRVLQNEGIESHVVDPASIATSRRRRRAKTDRIDGEALLRTLLAYKRGEPRVCAMVKAPTPEEEDRRRLCRERKILIAERVKHVNRIKGLLFCQGVSGYKPLRRDRRQRLDELRAMAVSCQSISRLRSAGNSLDSNSYLTRSRRWRPSGTPCLPRNESRRAHRRRCCSTSRVSGRSSPPSSGRKGCSDTSTIDARSLLTRA